VLLVPFFWAGCVSHFKHLQAMNHISVTNSQACGCCLKELKDFRKFSISDDVFFRLATELAKLQNHLYKAQSPFLEPGMPDGVAGS
jgi:hypothetical protein